MNSETAILHKSDTKVCARDIFTRTLLRNLHYSTIISCSTLLSTAKMADYLHMFPNFNGNNLTHNWRKLMNRFENFLEAMDIKDGKRKGLYYCTMLA